MPTRCASCGIELVDDPAWLEKRTPCANCGSVVRTLNGNPWSVEWNVVRAIGSGGQGSTTLVTNRDGTVKGVLKTLLPDRASDLQSRNRMHQEVTNLGFVANLGGRVPRILDPGNTVYFKHLDLQLFFVMEYVDGKKLSEVLARMGPQPPEKSIAITLDLLETLKAGHAEGILHRDIKPDNLIVSDFEQSQVFVVDYGLSFNRVADDDESAVTQTGEAIGNGFMDLPERRTPDAQRHYETDLSYACGILYFCLTGHEPRPPLDTKGNAPHRRPGKTVADSWPGRPELTAINSILDRGFQIEIVNRFNTADELIERLRRIGAGQAAIQESELADHLKAARATILAASRPAQLKHFKDAANHVLQFIHHYFMKIGRECGFIVRQISPTPTPGPRPSPRDAEWKGVDPVSGPLIHLVTVDGIDSHARKIQYRVGARGSECVVQRSMVKAKADKKRGGAGYVPVSVTPWVDVFFFLGGSDGKSMEMEQIYQDVMGTLRTAVDELVEEVRQHPGG